ncbi:MAG: hypothetical protein QXP05_06975 [Ignisphaera sp.]|uniref:Uncharacterized protein n=1 Tax=Ignisphaera aggregans TaxID=334771 RepID=A0A7J3N086_9CREN
MNYSSPGKAQRVLSRLERIGLVERTFSNEYVAKDLPPQLGMYIVFKGYIVPRIFIYAIYATTISIVFTVLTKPPLHLIILLIVLIIPYWIETINVIRILKKFLKK